MQSLDNEDDSSDEEADGKPADLENGETDPLLEEFDDMSSGAEEGESDDEAEDNSGDDKEDDDSNEVEVEDDSDEVEEEDDNDSGNDNLDAEDEELEWESSSAESGESDSVSEEEVTPSKKTVSKKNKKQLLVTPPKAGIDNQINPKSSISKLAQPTKQTNREKTRKQVVSNKSLEEGKKNGRNTLEEKKDQASGESSDKAKENEYEDGDTSDEEVTCSL